MRSGVAARVGRFQRQLGDAFAHFDGEIAKVQIRSLQLFGEYPREDRIMGGVAAAEPIQRRLADAGGIQREDPARRLGIGEPPRVADRAAGGARERIVAAGIDHQQRDANRARLQFCDQIGLGQRSAAHARFGAFGHGRDIARDQVIDARNRYAVSGKEQRRGVARLQPRGELGELVDHRLAAKIGADDDLETERPQRSRDRGGVVGGLLELPVGGQIGIEVVADGKRDALLGDGRRGRQACDGHQQRP